MEPVLAILDIDREMRVEVNASDYAMGEVLLTKYEDGKQRLVAFISKSLNTMKQNYKIYDKEMLAVIRCLEAWRHYLKGAKLEFEIQIDHKNLQYFMMSQNITNGHLLFVMGALILYRVQKCKVRQVTKDVVKSEV